MKLLRNGLIGVALALAGCIGGAEAAAPGNAPPIAVAAPGDPPVIAYSGTSAHAAFYADISVFPTITVINEGIVPVFCKIGTVSTVASTTTYDFEVAPNYGYHSVWAGNSTYVACISTGTSGNAKVTQSNGAPTLGSLGGNNGGGAVGSVTGQNGIICNPTTGSVLCFPSAVENAQTASYTLAATDGGKVVTIANASANVATLPGPATTGFGPGFSADIGQVGAGVTTVTSTANFDNGTTSIVLALGQYVFAFTNAAGTNYHSMVTLPVIPAGDIMANGGGSANYPTAFVNANVTVLLGSAPVLFMSGSPVSGQCPQFSGTLGAVVSVVCAGGSGSPGGATTQVQVNAAGSFGGIATMVVDLTHGYLTENASPGTDGIASKYGVLFNGIGNNSTNTTGCTVSTCFPLVEVGSGAAGGFSTGGDLLDVNGPSGFAGVFFNVHANGSTTSLFNVTTGGGNMTGSFTVSTSVVTGTVKLAATGTSITENTTDGVLKFTNNAATAATAFIMGPATTSGAAFGISTTGITAELGSLAAGGTFTASGGLLNSGIATGTNADFVCMTAGFLFTVQTSACTISDPELKTNKHIFSASLMPALMKLHTWTFQIKDAATGNRSRGWFDNYRKIWHPSVWHHNRDPNANQYQLGLMATDVAKLFPLCAIYYDDPKHPGQVDKTHPKSWRQECMIAALLKGWQEQQRQIANDNERIAALEARH